MRRLLHASIAVGLALGFPGIPLLANAAANAEHGGHRHHPPSSASAVNKADEPTGQEQEPDSKPSTMNHNASDHGGGHGDHKGHGHDDHKADTSTQRVENGRSPEDADGAARTTSRTPIPVLTDKDRSAVFLDSEGHTVHDRAIVGFFLLDKFEWRDADDGDALGWEISAWIGGDVNRLWLRSEGEQSDSETDAAEMQLLWGHSVGPWWDLVAGVRHDFEPGASQTWAAVGLQGLALYNFEAEASAFIGEAGQAAARLDADYDILISNRLILQSSAELNAYGKSDSERGIGSGLANLEIGLRLRYEIRREFAPYLGATWTRSYGNTAELIRERDDKVNETQWVAGLRIWF